MAAPSSASVHTDVSLIIKEISVFRCVTPRHPARQMVAQKTPDARASRVHCLVHVSVPKEPRLTRNVVFWKVYVIQPKHFVSSAEQPVTADNSAQLSNVVPADTLVSLSPEKSKRSVSVNPAPIYTDFKSGSPNAHASTQQFHTPSSSNKRDVLNAS